VVSWLLLACVKGDEQKEGARYHVNCCQGGDCWDLVTTNSQE
jgi:hypothetical protein